MKQQLNRFYAYQVWLTSVALLAAILAVRRIIIGTFDGVGEEITAFNGTFIAGFVFSIPAFLIYLAVYRQLRLLSMKVAAIKSILCLIAMIGIIITTETLVALDTDTPGDASRFYLICAIGITFSGFFFNLKSSTVQRYL